MHLNNTLRKLSVTLIAHKRPPLHLYIRVRTRLTQAFHLIILPKIRKKHVTGKCLHCQLHGNTVMDARKKHVKQRDNNYPLATDLRVDEEDIEEMMSVHKTLSLKI